jgi:3'-phosphoadenosine 5'-phosphosulfate sulfotransferase (PAPS reductase)/FAD synthetase
MPTTFQEKIRELDMAIRENNWARQRPDPFLIRGPAVISFSGGRTSAYMLHRILQAHDGKLPDDVVVLFQNTGREMEATLEFVRDVGNRWNVPVVWLEYDGRQDRPSYKLVDFQTASRRGEPFEQLLKRKSALPNPVSRFCTIELKIRTAKRFIVDTYGWKRWTNVVGLRRDEEGRVYKATDRRRNKKDRWDVICPLYEAGTEKHHVLGFWSEQPFDLRLAGPWEGNCDGCFLKSKASLHRMCANYPDQMTWWLRQEAVPRGDGAGKTFRKDRIFAKVWSDANNGAPLPKWDLADDLPCDDLMCGI